MSNDIDLIRQALKRRIRLVLTDPDPDLRCPATLPGDTHPYLWTGDRLPKRAYIDHYRKHGFGCIGLEPWSAGMVCLDQDAGGRDGLQSLLAHLPWTPKAIAESRTPEHHHVYLRLPCMTSPNFPREWKLGQAAGQIKCARQYMTLTPENGASVLTDLLTNGRGDIIDPVALQFDSSPAPDGFPVRSLGIITNTEWGRIKRLLPEQVERGDRNNYLHVLSVLRFLRQEGLPTNDQVLAFKATMNSRFRLPLPRPEVLAASAIESIRKWITLKRLWPWIYGGYENAELGSMIAGLNRTWRAKDSDIQAAQLFQEIGSVRETARILKILPGTAHKKIRRGMTYIQEIPCDIDQGGAGALLKGGETPSRPPRQPSSNP